GLAALAAAMLLAGGRRVSRRVFEIDPDNPDPAYLTRLSVAFWSTLLPTAAVVLFLAATVFLLDYFAVLRDDIRALLTALFSVVGVSFGVHRLARATLSPELPHWRLIPVEPRPAR